MSVKTRYSVRLLTLALIVLQMAYLDSGPMRRPGYIAIFVGVAGLLYSASCFDKGRYLSKGGKFIDQGTEPAKFRKFMRLDVATGMTLLWGGLAWVLMSATRGLLG